MHIHHDHPLAKKQVLFSPYLDNIENNIKHFYILNGSINSNKFMTFIDFFLVFIQPIFDVKLTVPID